MNNKELTDHVLDSYKNHMKKITTGGGRRPGLHVSDIVSDCIRKPWYRMADEEKVDVDERSMKNFYFGTAVHESFDGMFEVMEMKMTVNPFTRQTENDVKNIKTEIKKDPFSWVSGALDAVVKDDDGNPTAILDFKTMKKITTPYSSYVKQINFYSYMYFLYTGIFIDKGIFLCLDKSSGFQEEKVFIYDLVEPETNEELIRDIMIQIKGDEIPNRNESYFCNWCPYIKTCNPNTFISNR